jgi:hypothetical protein
VFEKFFTPSNSPLQRGRIQVSPLCKGGLRGEKQKFMLDRILLKHALTRDNVRI